MKEFPAESKERLNSLVREGSSQSLAAARGELYDDTNYLSAALSAGIIGKIYWVIPQGFFTDIPLAGDRIKTFLKETAPEFSHDEIDAMAMDEGCLRGVLTGADIHICSPRTLPVLAGPVLLSIHAAFIPQYAQESNISKLRALKWFFDYLAFKEKLRVLRADLSYGIESGTTEPVHRYIGDQLAEALSNPGIISAESPPELWQMRDTAENMLSGGEDRLVLEYLEEPLKAYPDDLPLRLLHAGALVRLKKYDEAYREAEGLCSDDRHYCYGLVYLGNLIDDEKADAWKGKFYDKALETLPESASLRKLTGRSLP